ncbi:GNAT family N-acetyltransferase [Clostridium hydrogeniformans]|uniref:GNAT family N-acetyltransferase n=1 Tax=Clostridium hydrogeniformans TaxID=349933 RepID=UPI000689C828|nr:GNAT family N-acetyltransferase [Clostridium hydrogeniformans]
MNKVEKLNLFNKKHMYFLNKKALEFNKYNEDFSEYMAITCWYKKILFLNKIYLLKIAGNYEGFLWYEAIDEGSYNIRSFYINPEYMEYDIINFFRNNIPGFKKSKYNFSYNCTYKEELNTILSRMGFYIRNSLVELKLNIENLKQFPIDNNIIEVFQESYHEELRCSIQNSVFYDENRIPLTLGDIFYEEKQSFYLKRGSVFIKDKNHYAGYGQIILSNKNPLIVNVGILEEYRNHGLGDILMKSLINICKNIGFKDVRIRCYADNYIALNLYKKLGFKEENYMFNWTLHK